jgi:hypothetical protein
LGEKSVFLYLSTYISPPQEIPSFESSERRNWERETNCLSFQSSLQFGVTYVVRLAIRATNWNPLLTTKRSQPITKSKSYFHNVVPLVAIGYLQFTNLIYTMSCSL